MTAETERAGDGIVLARRVAFTTVTGLFTFVASAALDGALKVSLAEQLILTAIVGSVTLLTQFLVEFERRLRELEVESLRRMELLQVEQRANIDEARHVINQGFARISMATELYTALEESALRTDALTQLVRRSSKINGASPQIIRDLAQVEIERMSVLLKSLSDGNEVIYDGEDQEYLLGLAATARHSIAATSLTTVDGGAAGFDGGIWTSDLGRRYLESQHAAVLRGVTVRRIFVFDQPTFRTDEMFARIRTLQEEAGVEVRVLKSDMVPERLKTGIFDFIVFDRSVCYETTAATQMVAGRAPAIVTTRLVLDDAWVQRRVDRFEALWEASSAVE